MIPPALLMTQFFLFLYKSFVYIFERSGKFLGAMDMGKTLDKKSHWMVLMH